MVGTSVGGYRIVRKLGQGGMGVVYEGLQPSIGRRVAIKVLHPEYADDGESLTRFFNEARAANRIPHPGIIQVSECGRMPSGAAFLVMEYLAGAVLNDYLESAFGKLSSDQAISIAAQVADALAAAHARGVVHRDVKPGNLMVVLDPLLPEGVRVKVLDFGLAKLETDSTSGRRTRSGAVLGTPLYMAPEQCMGAGHVDGKADVYALGVILFELLAGTPPFVDRSELGLMNLHVSTPAPLLRSLVPSAPAALCDLVQSMLAKSPSERPRMSDVHAALRRARGNRSIRALPIPVMPEPVDPLGPTSPQLRANGLPLPSVQRQSLDEQSPSAHLRRIVLSVSIGTLTGVALLWFTRFHGVKESPSETPADTHIEVPTVAPPSSRVQAARAQAVTPAAAMVQIDIDSTPGGAVVSDAETDRELGRTPFHTEISSTRKDLWLLLRKRGYQDRFLHLLLHSTAKIEKQEILKPARQLRGSSKATQKTLSIDELKSRMLNHPEAGAEHGEPQIAD